MPETTRKKIRVFGLVLALVLVLPVAGTGIAESLENDDVTETGNSESDDIAFISTQGRAVNGSGQQGKLVALDRSANEVVWLHDSYRRYFDVDILSEDRLLFSAWSESCGRCAFIYDWKEDEVIDSFQMPTDTHDVDYLGDGKYVVADKHHEPMPDHGIYIYDNESGERMWEWNFTDYYPKTAGHGYGKGKDYTHVNDVDPVDNGSKFLISPRNFDRVMLIDKETGSTEWTLGEEDNYEILNEQHHPVLLDSDQPTVLVGDSKNNRVVEYTKEDGEWKLTWAHYDLNWPRGVDRLPNGNTIIVDSANDRVIEVAPDNEIVWSYDVGGEVSSRNPYDVELMKYGEEHERPVMEKGLLDSPKHSGAAYEGEKMLKHWYQISAFVFPPWVRMPQFLFLLGAAGVLTSLLYIESGYWLAGKIEDIKQRRSGKAIRDSS